MKGGTVITIAIIVIGIAALVYLSIEQNSTDKELEELKELAAMSELATQEAAQQNNNEVPKQNYTPKKGVVPLENNEMKPADYSTIQQDILESPIVQDLPKDAVMNLKFYNFNTGEREWEKSYILKKNSVEEGETIADMTIIIASKYVAPLKTESTCNVLIAAKNNGDFGVNTEMTDSALMWKYKSMLEYRECLGL
ncbi:MAG: hypothetical protein PF542_03510 [Nanoarchaeota archaeon]|jgi:type II secretory pathway pseudopilin PulG|nr:hypothetical protein [Nanoarchaeota archaeon]